MGCWAVTQPLEWPALIPLLGRLPRKGGQRDNRARPVRLEAALLNHICLGLEAAKLPGGSRWNENIPQHLQTLPISPCQGQRGTGKAREFTFHGERQRGWDSSCSSASREMHELHGSCHPAQLSLAKALGSTSKAGSGFSSSISFCLVY